MSLKIIDGFDYFVNTTGAALVAEMASLGWSGDLSSAMVVSSTTAFGYGKSLSPHGGSGLFRVERDARGRVPNVWGDTMGTVGMRVFIPSVPGPGWFFGVIDSMTVADTVQWLVQFNYLGDLFLYRGLGNPLITKTPAWVFHPGQWNYFEFQWKPGTMGSMEIRVNNVTVLDLPVVDLTSGTLVPEAGGEWGFDTFFWQFQPAGQRWYMDDFYYLTDEGDNNNTFLGKSRIKAHSVASPGDLTGWTIGGTSPAATNWQSVDTLTTDDSQYNYANTVGARDLYQINPISDALYTFGIEITGFYKASDSGPRGITQTFRTAGAIDVEGTEHILTDSYHVFHDLWELNPDTGVFFTGTEINALQIGPKVSS